MSRLIHITTIGLLAACNNNHLDRFDQTNLVSNQSNAAITDPGLINAWGLVVDSNDQMFIAANGTGEVSSYTSQLVAAPGFPLLVPDAAPITGLAINETPGFVVTGDLGTGPAQLLTVTEDGQVFAFSAGVTSQPISVLNMSTTGASFKGATIITGNDIPTLLVADFTDNRVIAVDSSFHVIVQPSNAIFVDSGIPTNFGPFGIQTLDSLVYVTYAEHGDGIDELDGAGLGVVDAFTFDGTFVQRISAGPELNAPWGLALAPSNFDGFSGALLVGNFGDGAIHAYDPQTADLLGTIEDRNGNQLIVPGLWGIAFGAGGDDQTMFFAAGPNDESNGLFGKLTAHD